MATSIRVLAIGILLAMLAVSSKIGALADDDLFEDDLIYGFTSQYHNQAGADRNDLSGAAVDDGRMIFVDDGGSPSDFNFVRVFDEWLEPGADADADAVNIAFTLDHKDLEGATSQGGYYIATTSLSKSGTSDDDLAQRRVTRFQINDDATDLVNEESVDVRDDLMDALEDEFGSDWFDRIKDAPAKSGGLNIEAVAAEGDDRNGNHYGHCKGNGHQNSNGNHNGHSHGCSDSLMLGLRSPLFGSEFGDPADGGDTRAGVAIVAEVSGMFSGSPTFEFHTLDLDTGDEALGQHGIRGMEYIPALEAYVIIGGAAQKADDYTLWLWELDGDLEQIELDGFDQLCRPESVMQIQLEDDDEDYLAVISEESGAPCVDAPFTYILAELDD